MARFKPLLPVGENCAIERVVQTFLEAGILEVIVVTGYRAEEILHRLAPLAVCCVKNADYRQGMFSSVRAGIEALPTACKAFFVHPADIPLVRSHTIRRLAAAFEESAPTILYPTFKDHRGHPSLVSSSLAAAILNWKGEGGLRAFLQEHEADSREMAVADEAILLDMDTPQDYHRVQALSIRGDLPSAAECRALMESIQILPTAVITHCRTVATIARRLADALGAAGVRIDSDLAETAALLHDIARTQADHARTGAKLLEAQGFLRLSPLVADHMDLEVDGEAPLDESQIVFLADKLAAGDRPVDLEERFDRKMAKYGQEPATAARIAHRRDNARRVRDKVEAATGLNLKAIIEGTDEVKETQE
jgi:putative nucleotidyltransferase with HDIG domain